MIESSPFTVNLARVDVGSEDYDEIVSGIESLEYDRERSYGFVTENFEPNTISAYLVITTPVKMQDFDEQKEDIVTKEVDKTELIPFRIDVNLQYLEIFSNQNDASRVTTRLGEATDWKLSITESPLDLSEVYKALLQTDWDIVVNSLQVSNFSVSENTSGSYRMKVFNQSEARKYLEEYQNNISYLGVQFEDELEETTIGFYRSGSVRFYSQSENDGQILQSIKRQFAQSNGVMPDA